MNDDRFDRWVDRERRRMVWRDRLQLAAVMFLYLGSAVLVCFTAWLLFCVYVVVTS